MLRSWTERIRVYLHPEQIVLVRETGIFRRRLLAKRTIPVEIAGEQIWDGALTALQAALRQPEWHKAGITVILSSEFVRFRIAHPDVRLSAVERVALLHHQFEEVYGEAAENWRISVSEGGFDKPGLACAVDPQLMAGLRDACVAADARLVSIKPYLMAAFNCWRRKVDPRGAWLVVAEPSTLTIACLRQGAWHSIRSQRSMPGWENDLELLLAREALQLGMSAETLTVCVFWPERPASKPPLPDKFSLQLLQLPIIQGYSPLADKQMAVALCA